MIAIVGGTGPEGTGLALRWARAGEQVVIGSRDGARAQAAAADIAQRAGVLGGVHRDHFVMVALVGRVRLPSEQARPSRNCLQTNTVDAPEHRGAE